MTYTLKYNDIASLFETEVKFIKLKGYSSSNKEVDVRKKYSEGKKPLVKHYTNNDFIGLNRGEFESWISNNGWVGLLIPHNYIAIDIDDKKSGNLVLNFLIEQNLSFYGIETPNGFQFLFKDSGLIKSQQTKSLTVLGFVVDYRLAGKGYIVLPTKNTENRSWLNLDKENVDLLPFWFNPLRHFNNEDLSLLPIYEGNRDSDLFKHASRLQSYGYEDKQIYEVLELINQNWVYPPMDSKIIMEKVKSATKYEKGSLITVKKSNQNKELLELTRTMTFNQSIEGIPYAKVFINDHYEYLRIDSEKFKLFLMNIYFAKYKMSVNSSVVTNVQNTLHADAIYNSPKMKVHQRIAELDGVIYLDLCNDKWQTVKISKNGWQLEENPHVIFKRTNNMLPLPIPKRGGDIEQLRPFLNLRNTDDFLLLVAWIISLFRQDYPIPVLAIQGEQGSAKSTLSKVIRNLVDPSTQPLQTFPNDDRDLFIKANNSWVLAFDNLSGITERMSDSLCKLSTGGGFSTRKLYSDDEEISFSAIRPIILNGIDDIVKRADLLDRSIILNLPTLQTPYRKTEAEFWGDFEKVKAQILGALLDMLSKALKNLDKVNITEKPRMIDFATLASAAWIGMEWDKKYNSLVDIYNANRNLATDQGIDSDPFATAIIKLMSNKEKWTGTVTDALKLLSNNIGFDVTKTQNWPSANKFKDRVRRIAPALRSKGIIFEELPRTNKEKKIMFQRQSA